MDMGLRGRKAIVCASSRGLGKACALALAREGCLVVVNGIDPARVFATAREIESSTGASVFAIRADVTMSEGREALLAACPDPDILVNNNAGPPPGTLDDWNEQQWIAALEANLLSPVFLMKAVLPGMRARKFGRIVNITSGIVKAPRNPFGLSVTARTGLMAMSKALAKEAVADNVTINNILPARYRPPSGAGAAANAGGKDQLRRGHCPHCGGSCRQAPWKARRAGCRLRLPVQRPSWIYFWSKLAGGWQHIRGIHVAMTRPLFLVTAESRPLGGQPSVTTGLNHLIREISAGKSSARTTGWIRGGLTPARQAPRHLPAGSPATCDSDRGGYARGGANGAPDGKIRPVQTPLLTRFSMRIRTRSLTLLAAALFLAIASICKAAETDIRAGVVPIIDLAQFYAAQEQGYFRAEGLNVEAVTGTTSAALLPALTAGRLQFVSAAIVTFLQGVEQGIPFRAIAPGTAIVAPPPDISPVAVLKAGPIKTAKDLEGRTLAVASLNGNQWLYIRAYLEKQGAELAKVKFREVPFPQQFDALASGQVDAAAMTEPFATRASESSKVSMLFYPYTETQPVFESVVLVTTVDWARDHPELVRRYLRAYLRGQAYTNERKKTPEGVRLISSYTKLDPEVVAKIAVPEFRSTLDLKSIEQTAGLMVRHGLLKTVPDLRAAIVEPKR
jgi:3-oxoacyl-[acyl-carrier protein] reductase